MKKLYIILSTLLIAFLIHLYFRSLFPTINFNGLYDIDNDLNRPRKIYRINKTNVHLIKGNIFKFDSLIQKENNAVGISSKLNLTPPFVPISIEKMLRDSLKVRYGSSIDKKIRDIFKNLDSSKLYKVYKQRHFITDKLPWRLQYVSNIYLIAGISAINDSDGGDGKESQFITNQKPELIKESIKSLCTKAFEDRIDNLGIPVIGTGAGKVSKEVALDKILTGINEVSSKDKAPNNVFVILYPGKSPYKPEDEAKWLEYGEVLRQLLNRNKIYDKEYSVWNYLKSRIWFTQLIIILLLPGLSFILTQFFRDHLPIHLTWDVVIKVWFKWSLIFSGIISLTDFKINSEIPFNDIIFTIITILIFTMPIAEWFQFGNPKEKTESNRARLGPNPSD